MRDLTPVHAELVSAGRDLDRNLSGDIPPFKPRSETPARITVVAITLVVAGLGIGGFLRLADNSQKTETDFASERSGTESEDPIDSTDGTADGERGAEGTLAPDPDPDPDRGEIVVAKTDFTALSTDKIYRAQASLARPTTTEASTDDQFGVSMQAVTDAEPGNAILSPANTAPAWNADGTRLVLYRTGSDGVGHELLDGQTYQPIATLSISPLDVHEIYWDPTDSNRFYYVEQESFNLIAFDIGANKGSTVHTFDCDEMNGVGLRRLSADGRIFAHNCLLGSQRYYVAFDLKSGEETRVPTDFDSSPQPTPTSGLFVVNNGEAGTDVLDASLKKVGSLPVDEYVDGVVVETLDGRDLFVAAIYGSNSGQNGSVVAFDVASGATEVVVGGEKGYPYPPSGTAMTVSSANTPLVAVSIAGSGTANELLDGELLLVDFTDVEPTVHRLGQHRSVDSVERLDEYWSRPGIALDPASQRVLFSSDWGQDRVDSFVIDFGGTHE